MVHSHLRSFLDQRVRDGVIRRMIDKWLKAGVMEEGRIHFPEDGSPQGGVISPLLANIYLHEVLDVWFETVVKPRLRGQARLIRYADDFVICFEREDDARRLPKCCRSDSPNTASRCIPTRHACSLTVNRVPTTKVTLRRSTFSASLITGRGRVSGSG